MPFMQVGQDTQQEPAVIAGFVVGAGEYHNLDMIPEQFVVAHEGMEAGCSLQMHDSDELSTEIRVHWRQQASWLDAVLDEGVNQDGRLGG